LNIKLTNRGNTLVAVLNGELDHHTAEYIRQKLDAEMMKSTTKTWFWIFRKLLLWIARESELSWEDIKIYGS